MNVRIIPRLDIKGPNLVKGIHLEGLRILGKPKRFARYYYECGADELLYVDAVASLYGRNSLLDVVRETSREIFIPLTVAGGLRTLDDIRAVLRAGADKIAVNTGAIRRPELIEEASRAFGCSTIVVAIEAIRHADGSYEAYTDYGRERTGIDALRWAREAERLGAGELIVTSINREGTGQGMDLELIRAIAESVAIPVIAHGGVGKVEHLREAVVSGGADALCMASVLHYDCLKRVSSEDADYSKEGNTEFLKRGSAPSKIEACSLQAIKQYLREQGISNRPGVAPAPCSI